MRPLGRRRRRPARHCLCLVLPLPSRLRRCSLHGSLRSGGVGVQIRTGNICLDFYNLGNRFQAFDCGGTSAYVNEHYDVDVASKTIFTTGQGPMAPYKGMSLCMHSVAPGPPKPPPPPPKSALWCPQYHEIQGHCENIHNSPIREE